MRKSDFTSDDWKVIWAGILWLAAIIGLRCWLSSRVCLPEAPPAATKQSTQHR